VAVALRVEAQAGLGVPVNELRVLAHRAEDSPGVDGAEKHGVLSQGGLHDSNLGHRRGPEHRPNVYARPYWCGLAS
jgi:hypothetical protein